MSSYFDKMGYCARNPQEIANLVFEQYRWYLRKLCDEVIAKDRDRLYRLMQVFEVRVEKAKSGLWKDNPELQIQEIHTFAHDLAEAHIRLKGGRRASDNPPLPY